MTPEEKRKFLETQRLAVVGFERRSGPPHLTPVYYVLDGDDLLISTTKTRLKAKLAERSGRLSICVLGEQQPFPYLTVSGRAVIEDDFEAAVRVMMRVGERMSGSPVAESARPAIEERARKEHRVVLRVTPESYYPS